MKRILLAAGILVAASLAALIWRLVPAQPGGNAGRSRAVHEDLVGRKVEIAQDVKRIILLRSKDIYLLAALLGEELPEKLVGRGPDLRVDDTEVHQRLLKRFPRLGEIAVTGDVYGDTLSVEQLLQLKPDLVISDRYLRDKSRACSQQMESAGLPVVYLDGSSDPLTGAQNGLALLGRLLHKEDRAREVADYITRQIDLVTGRIASRRPAAPSVYLEAGFLGPQGYGQTYGLSAISGKNTSWGTILQALKVRNVAEGRVVGMAPISPEALLVANPDIIVITGQNWSRFKSPGGMQLGFNVSSEQAQRLLGDFTTRPGWGQLAAVKNKRLYSVFHNTVSPTVFSAIQSLAKSCYPDVFGDLDPERNLREFYQRFMPIALDGTWMCGLDVSLSPTTGSP